MELSLGSSIFLLYICSMKETDKYDIVSASTPSGLSAKVRDLMQLGWKPVGSHQVVVSHISVERAGTQHRYQLEYTQTIIR